MRHVQRVIDRVQVVQIDSVNVVSRSHYLPFLARLGPYDRDLVDRACSRAPRRLVESWAHMASLVPPTTWPLLDFRMRLAEQESWGGVQTVRHEFPGLVAAVLDEVERKGPMTSREAEVCAGPRRSPQPRPLGLELVGGQDLARAALPVRPAQLGRPDQPVRTPVCVAGDGRTASRSRPLASTRPSVRREEDAILELVRLAARAHGVGTELCLRDYFRLKSVQVRPAIARLVETGELEPVTIAGWGKPAWLHAEARIPRRVHAEALLSPFDSLVWQRERTEALYDLRYRIEIYTPQDQRIHGYYVLPFLFGDSLVARVDLKADRAAGVLRLNQVTWQPGAPREARPALLRNLASMADWLGLDDGVVEAVPA